jgi:hypothetical protein
MTDILTKPEWIPWYVQRVKGSSVWKELKDFQFGWYVRLLTELADSATPGYLPNEVGVLWKLAGAQTESFFKMRGGIELLARHFNRTADGLRIYNARMLEVLHEQGHKRAKRRTRTLSSLVSVVQGLPDWVPQEEFAHYIEMREKIRKPLTAHAVKLLVGKIDKLRAEGYTPKELLEEATVSNWLSVWPIRREANGNGRQISQAGKCSIHPDSGSGPQGQCWACYNESPAETLQRIRSKAHAVGASAAGK